MAFRSALGGIRGKVSAAGLTPKRGDFAAFATDPETGEFVSDVVTDTPAGRRVAGAAGVGARAPRNTQVGSLSERIRTAQGLAAQMGSGGFGLAPAMREAPTADGMSPAAQLRERQVLGGAGSVAEQRRVRARMNQILSERMATRQAAKTAAEAQADREAGIARATEPARIRAEAQLAEAGIQQEISRAEIDARAASDAVTADIARERIQADRDIAERNSMSAEDRARIKSEGDIAVARIKEGSQDPTDFAAAADGIVESMSKLAVEIEKANADAATAKEAKDPTRETASRERAASLQVALDDMNGLRGLMAERAAEGLVARPASPADDTAVIDAEGLAGSGVASEGAFDRARQMDINGDGETSPDEIEFNTIDVIMKQNPDMPATKRERLRKRQSELREVLGL